MDVCSVWTIVLFVLTAVAVTGHVIWLVAAAVLRAIFQVEPSGGTSEPPVETGTICVLCGQRVSARQRSCVRCGLNSRGAPAKELRELESTRERLADLERTGHLQPHTHDVVRHAIDERRHELVRQLEESVGYGWLQAKKTSTGRPEPEEFGPEWEELAGNARKPQMVPTARPVEATPSTPPTMMPVLVDEPEAEIEPAIELPPPPLPLVPRRTFGEMLTGFMEERNILWGELVGGLLIVGCSIALVISLREALEKIPYFPFLMVASVAAALIGAGRYTLSHWKLESTSRGLLVIGTLLVPLSFTILAGLAYGREGGPVEFATEVAALAFFTWLVRGALDIVLRQSIGTAATRPDWLTAAIILGASASQLLVPHIIENDLTRDFLGLVGYVPAAFFVAIQGMSWQRVYRRETVSARQAGGLFLGLALAAYAVVITFGFILYKAENVHEALKFLAVPVALAGLPLLLGGTIATAKLPKLEGGGGQEIEPDGLPLGVAGVIATMLTLGGALVLLLALGAAWPNPVRLTAIAAINAAVLTFVAYRFRLAPAYLPAQLCLAVAVLTGYHALAGNLFGARAELSARLLKSWMAQESGVVLLGLGATFAAVAELLMRGRRSEDGHCLGIGSGVAAVASLILVAADGWQTPGPAALVFTSIATVGWLTNLRWRLTWLTAASAWLVAGAAFFTLVWFDRDMPLPQMVVWSLISVATAGVALAQGVKLLGRTEQGHAGELDRVFVVPLQLAALPASCAAAALLLATLHWDWLAHDCAAALLIGLVWLALAWQRREPILFSFFQGATAVAVLLGVVSVLQGQPWFTNDAQGLLGDIRSWQAYGIGLSALALAWVAGRFAIQGSPRLTALREPGWPALDRLLLGGLVVAALVVTVTGAAPGLAQELTALPLNAPLQTPQLLQMSASLGWCWLGLLSAALGLSLWQKHAVNAVLGLVTLGICGVALAAAAFADDIAVASAMRWGLALYFVGVSALLWLREHAAQLANAWGIHGETGRSVPAEVGALLVVGAALPMLILTAVVAEIGFAREHPTGPLAQSIFHAMGVVANNMAPLALLCFGLAGCGLRERSADYTFAAGLVALVTVTGGHALGIVTGGGLIGGQELIEIGQLATTVLALWLLGWLEVRRRLGQGLEAAGPDAVGASPCSLMLTIHERLLWACTLLWLAPALQLLIVARHFPSDARIITTVAGSWLGWLAFVLAGLAGTANGADAKISGARWLARINCAGLIAGLLAACTCTLWDDLPMWLACHVLTLSWLILAGGLLMAGWRVDCDRHGQGGPRMAALANLLPKGPLVHWVSWIGATVAVLEFFGDSAEPLRPAWPVGMLLAVSMIFGAIAIWTRRGGFIYGSGLLLNAVGQLFWLHHEQFGLTIFGLGTNTATVSRLQFIHIGCLGLGSLMWSGIQLGGLSLWGLPEIEEGKRPFRHVALRVGLWALVTVVGLALLNALLEPGSGQLDLSVWYATAVLMVASAATLWDGAPQKWARPLPQLYVLGLAVIGIALQQMPFETRWLIWGGNMALASFVLLTAGTLVIALQKPDLVEALGFPRRPNGWPLTWFGPAQTIVGAVVLICSLWVSLTFEEMGARLCAVVAMACLPAGCFLLTPHWGRLTPRGSPLAVRNAALTTALLAVVGCVLLHCSFVGPQSIAPWLHRSVLAMAAVTWMAAIYGLLLPRVLPSAGDWAKAATRLAAPLGMAACAILGLVMVQEFFLYDASEHVRRTPLHPAGVVVVTIALAVLIGGALTFAVSPGRDRFKLSERGRTLYVYAAEILVVLLLFHLRLNVPDFFPSVGKHWVFVIMAVAFLGVGLSELCRRRGLSVLADPVQRTAMLLPLLPLIAFMVQPLKEPLRAAAATFTGLSPWVRYLDRVPDDYHLHAAVWFLVGLLYLVVAVSRRSSNLALGAAVVANFGLWVLLGHHDQLTFLVHPQLWLIPIGVIVLIAENLNRERLQESQALALRYAGMLMIYVSSSADMFIAGLGESALMPIVLAVLAVAGVLVGILLRVRAFLLLGVTFLFLVVFSQIWHAAVDRAQTWVWWASGLVLGVAILTLFALFEKRRNDVLKMIEDIKRWR